MAKHGIHHVTAIAGPARRNLDFYTRVLGLRLVKKTVNFDDPGTYHFYYGDGAGSPGTILTFFPWEHAAPGRQGTGELQETVFRVPQGAIGFWMQRLMPYAPERSTRFGETVLSFRDSDGMRLALAGVPGIEAEPAWENQEIPAEFAIRGFHSVSLMLADGAATGAILSDVFGFAKAAKDGNVTRYQVPGSTVGGIIDLRSVGDFLPARLGRGSVHHLAFRAADDAEEMEMQRKLAANHGIHTTEQKDRNYFRSLYFREPGHVLFEIATDIPGFAVDEPAVELGQSLKLPGFLEAHRSVIEASLPALA
ncbi:ring-cleaving dioxygenase [Roseomonas marmotae]|uniref:Ring-cleaving dioxygenase n=1 Tax=Roseomonas marmotae TaxID=2768161 RepID=A0ABS3KFV3_9PROT|nr:ring-cleaving dioxygenase [Roseomonas marmotae]MBO1075842.1 ring-cleaving dioxygenase [Roseomonas marmotae]QTI81966.1 ring-cleaving dioxygenase [Roseomonas marmotae]